jgi:mono/diheme cytochrome c family protein
VVNWLRQHFKDPEMVSPGSRMLAVNLDEGEIRSLITFTLGLAKPDIPFSYFSLETLEEFKGRRNTLSGELAYPLLCSACHGKEGEGKNFRDYQTGVPGVGLQDFLSVASLDFIRFAVYHGRGGREMPAWLPRNSGLIPDEISGLADLVKSRRTIRSTWNAVSDLGGETAAGRVLYERYCRACHGSDGRGLPIIGIFNPDLLAAAPLDFLYRTVVTGRENTAMPGWGRFTADEMADLAAFLVSRRTRPVRRAGYSRIPGDPERGGERFHYLCSRCHGLYGQGDTGPAVLNADFQAAAPDSFLHDMIAGGRSGTAMFGWASDVPPQNRLTDADIADLIAYMRFAPLHPPEIIPPGPSFGSAGRGETLYQSLCVECHGVGGEGPKAPALDNQEFLNAATNGFLFATLTLGRRGTDMPSWGLGTERYPALGVQERQDLVSFLRRWQRVVIKKTLQDRPPSGRATAEKSGSLMP